jgi:hypothetical protein
MMEEWIPIASRYYWFYLSLLVLSRATDFLSTWIATPNLTLEGNPIAKKLGWRGATIVNLMACVVFAAWPLVAISFSTTSVLVAARNFQSAWLMRTLGEEQYRDWEVQRLQETSLALYLFCLFGQTLLTAGVGGMLMYFYDGSLVPFSIGLGIIAYAAAVAVYTLLSFWRIRRATG